MNFSDSTKKVALVTGGARRIGAEIASQLHEANYNVIVHYDRSKEEAHHLCAKLNQKRDQSAIAINAHLSGQESAEKLIQDTINVWSQLDVLVNNASQFYRTFVGQVNETDWDNLLNSNLKAPFFLAQAAAPFLKATHGTIINITDIHANHPMGDYSVYCISKCGLLMMTRALAKELGPTIRVNAVAPGAILWPEGENTLSTQLQEKIIERTSLKHAGSADDIAKAVLFFVQDAKYITGQVLNVDGGREMA